MKGSWKESIYLQREELARKLHEPLAQLAERCRPAWGDRAQLNAILAEGFSSIPHCSFLYCVNTDGIQICDNVGQAGLAPEHFGRDRSQRKVPGFPSPQTRASSRSSESARWAPRLSRATAWISSQMTVRTVPSMRRPPTLVRRR